VTLHLENSDNKMKKMKKKERERLGIYEGFIQKFEKL